jgi:flavin reductase (DIM6/NTAB) family NADH-FMN oxidoreductase RutF
MIFSENRFALFRIMLWRCPESGGPRDSRAVRHAPSEQERMMHGRFEHSAISIEPAILYFGTPVVLIGSTNEDGSYNLSPMSSAWWLGWRCMLGLGRGSKTTENLMRTGECVLNLPSADLVAAVDRLARTTGSNPVPAGKTMRGYRHEKDKFGLSGLTPLPAESVGAPRVAECPVQMEAKLVHVHALAQDDPTWRGHLTAIEVRITRIHAQPEIMMDGESSRIDPDKWRPLIMSFQQFYGLTPERLQRSELGQIPEAMYRPPDWRPAD